MASMRVDIFSLPPFHIFIAIHRSTLLFIAYAPSRIAALRFAPRYTECWCQCGCPVRLGESLLEPIFK
jgi:hypothetical protein